MNAVCAGQWGIKFLTFYNIGNNKCGSQVNKWDGKLLKWFKIQALYGLGVMSSSKRKAVVTDAWY